MMASDEPASQQLILRFFDQEVRIQSDSCRMRHLFAQMFSRFQVEEMLSPAERRHEFAVLTEPHNLWGRPVVILDGEVCPLPHADLPEDFLFQTVLNAINASVRSHILLHAGAVVYDGQGIMLAAASRCGKTTLVLELVRRRFQFLSDHIAALGRADHLMYPYPRQLGVRSGTLALTGFDTVPPGALAWQDRVMVDIETFQPESMGAAAPVTHIVILHNPAADETKARGDLERTLTLQIDRLDDDFLTAVRQIKGVTDIHPTIADTFPMLTLQIDHRTSVLSRIEALCRQRQVVLLDVIKRIESRPTFTTPARLEPLPKHQAIMELIRQFKGGHHSALLHQDCGGSAARLYIELAEIAGKADCYQLSVGPLQSMANLVCDLV